MGIFSNKISREELKPGDHIYSWRTAYVYAHHGIYVGDGKVIHFTRGGGRLTCLDRFIASACVNIPQCLNSQDHSSDTEGVISSCLDCFLAGGKLYLFEYHVSCVKFLAKPRSGTSTLAPSDPPHEVLYRANYFLKQSHGFGNFHVSYNNCEDFALYCKTGLLDSNKKLLGLSGQVNTVGAASVAALIGCAGVPMASVVMYCIGRLVGDIGMARRSVIKVPVEELVAMYNRISVVQCYQVEVLSTKNRLKLRI